MWLVVMVAPNVRALNVQKRQKIYVLWRNQTAADATPSTPERDLKVKAPVCLSDHNKTIPET